MLLGQFITVECTKGCIYKLRPDGDTGPQPQRKEQDFNKSHITKINKKKQEN